MPSLFGHAMAAVALGAGYNRKLFDRKLGLLGIVCAILPDADVLAFALGIDYASFWGHRGFSHSLVFAIIISLVVTGIFYRDVPSLKQRTLLAGYFFLCTASHGVLDALTNGGLGVAFFSPLNNTRYFFAWQPIQVSPLGVGSFFSSRGMAVLASEFIWIALPALTMLLVVHGLRAGINKWL